MHEPTEEDLAIDLATRLQAWEELKRFPHPPLAASVATFTRIGEAAIRRALAAEAEVKRLQALTEGLAARVAAQSELLSKRAMKEPCVRAPEDA